MRPGRWGQAWVVYRGGMCVYWLTPTHHARPPGPRQIQEEKTNPRDNLYSIRQLYIQVLETVILFKILRVTIPIIFVGWKAVAYSNVTPFASSKGVHKNDITQTGCHLEPQGHRSAM